MNREARALDVSGARAWPGLAGWVFLRYHIRTVGGAMNIRQDIRPVTYLKTKAAAVLDQINDTHRPIIITQDGEPRAVIQDPESYESMRQALAMLKLLAQGEEDVRRGRAVPQERVFAGLRARLKKA